MNNNKRTRTDDDGDEITTTTTTQERFVFVGLSVMDVVLEIQGELIPDSKTRAIGRNLRIGGNATNSAVVMSKLLGKQTKNCVHVISQLAPRDDPDTKLVLQHLESHGVDTSLMCFQPQSFKIPTSYIITSQATSSRTIINYRDRQSQQELLKYEFVESALRLLGEQQQNGMMIFHFEGRNVPEVLLMVRWLDSEPGYGNRFLFTVELEKIRGEGEFDERRLLMENPSLVVFSSQWVRERYRDLAGNLSDVVNALIQERWLFINGVKRDTVLVFTQGEHGATSIEFHVGDDAMDLAGHRLCRSPAVKVSHKIVDSTGAGDTFLAALLHARFHSPTSKDVPSAVMKANEITSHYLSGA